MRRITIFLLLLLVSIVHSDYHDGVTMRYVHAMTSCDETLDGDRVRVFRCLGGQKENGDGGHQRMTLDPFLIFDAYRNTERSQFEKGFPAHPHRGFLELRYIVAGSLAHNDSCGHRGVTTNGGVQALFTGRGIVHEELPVHPDAIDNSVDCDSSEKDQRCNFLSQQTLDTQNHFRGFQIWVNVPNNVRSRAPAYQTYSRAVFPQYHLAHQAGTVTLFAGRWPGSPTTVPTGPIDSLLDWSTGLLFAEIELNHNLRRGGGDNQWVVINTPRQQHVLLYVLEGALIVGDADEEVVTAEIFAFLGPGEVLRVSCSAASTSACKFIFLTAPRIKEPVIVSGGFVAGSEAEIKAAMNDLQEGRNTHC
ncbi:pirin domain-containing protein, putative [Bodo saltans]|uniref:Pirin domain-containing protein, putative n=1 Tax=Bodo saltans TaxID=75058 RepID=A0A0S4IR71_BODSA|nr:pirin domain-containing protein, putative [Bodo saltans]|eukprot:CUF29562.1 pirin domain-containing protein, putative [Bodo saltans]